jgi:hypothetical protein
LGVEAGAAVDGTVADGLERHLGRHTAGRTDRVVKLTRLTLAPTARLALRTTRLAPLRGKETPLLVKGLLTRRERKRLAAILTR